MVLLTDKVKRYRTTTNSRRLIAGCDSESESASQTRILSAHSAFIQLTLGYLLLPC